MKNKLNNKGMGRKELMLVFLIIFAGIAVGLYKIIGNNEVTQLANFNRLATSFIDNAGKLRDNEILYEERVFLYDVINLEYGDELESPFKHDEYCDVYESKIEMKNRQVFLTFKCSEYYIYNQPTYEEKYIIYKVSEWTDEKLTGANVQTANFYNVKVNGNELLDDYYIEKEFLVNYETKTGYKTNILTNLRGGDELVTKTYYRTIEAV